MESLNPNPEVFQLPSNSKGHCVRDIVYYLTKGFTNLHGTPTIHVLEGALQSAELQTLEFHPVEYYDMTMSEKQFEAKVLERSRQNLMAIHARVHSTSASSEAHSASMCHRDSQRPPNSNVSASLLSNGSGTSSKSTTGHGGTHQVDDSTKDSFQTSGSGAKYEHGPTGPSHGARSMAMLRSSHSDEASLKRSWGMDPLCNLQPAAVLHSEEGKQCSPYQDRELCDGATDVAGAAVDDARMHADCGNLSSHAKEDRCRRVSSPCRGQGDLGTKVKSSGLRVSFTSRSFTQDFTQEEAFTNAIDPIDANEVNNSVVGDGNQSSGIPRSTYPGNGSTPDCGGKGATHEDHPIENPKLYGNFVGRHGRGSVSGLREGDALKTEYYKPVTPKIASKVMFMATTLLAVASSTLTSFSLDDRDGLWEVACAPHSWLSDAAQRQGLHPSRVNLEAGFDLYKSTTWDNLRELRKVRRPRRLWLSFPCTFWCPWTSLNYATQPRKEILENHRRRERRMLWNFHKFLAEALEDDPELLVYFEWPHPCYGWSQQPLQAIGKLFQQYGLDWESCRIDGCRYGMVDEDGLFLKKKWMIKTNDNHFHSQFRAKVCVGCHAHGRIEGKETQKSAYYPWKMCQAIARFWSSQLSSSQQIRRMNHHDTAEIDWDEEQLSNPTSTSIEPFPVQKVQKSTSIFTASAPILEPQPFSSSTELPTQQQRDRWLVKLIHFHKAAGHCSSRNLARIVRDANLEPWKIKMAVDFKCPTCESLKPGGISSGQVPPAATHAQFGPWEAVGLDVSEWTIPGKTTKLKFLLMIDMATRLRAVQPLLEAYDITTIKHENAEKIIQAFSAGWLGAYPKPQHIIADNGKSFTSSQFGDFCREAGIELSFPAEKEAWAHGLVEKAIKDLKFTASAIQVDNMVQKPEVTLQLAASALNSTEHASGYTSHQWAFGRDYTINEEDRRAFAQLGDRETFATLVAARQRAEEVANKTRSQRILVRLGNSKARQPLRSFEIADLVMIWRQVLPLEVHTGPRGGMKKSSKPGWVGPGRVIFTEMLPHQAQDDPRRHIVWVLLHGKLLRCSVHSVRPVTPTEKLHHEIHRKEDITKWKSLSDLLPRREFQDITDEVPSPDQLELPHLPSKPDDTTVIPARRAMVKRTLFEKDWKTIHRSTPLGLGGSSSSTSQGLGLGPASPGLDATSPGSHELEPNSPDGEEVSSQRPMVNDYDDQTSSVPHPDQPEPKRPRNMDRDIGNHWIEQLQVDAQQEAETLDIFSAFQQSEECLSISFDLHVESHRQKKGLERNPVLYLTKKMNGAEVQLQRLSSQEKALFHRAKMKEVDSFLKNQAVRKCLDDQELRRAVGSGRISKARWVLTWKLTPPDEFEQAQKEAKTDPNTVLTFDGGKKAKARIVLLGFQHPSLLDPTFKTSAPVQSMIGRNLIYLLAVQHQWSIHGLDLATAFLQTQPTEADQEIWTTGVQELRQALGVSEGGVLRVLRNVYGSTTAPRGLWLSLHRTLVDLGAKPVLGERCLWAWYSSIQKDETGQFPRLIGLMGGHVDDFHCVGDPHSQEWKAIYAKILSAYKWGTAKENNYRHAGTDLKTIPDGNGNFKITIDQDAYIETVADLEIPPDRLHQDGPLQPGEKAACRTALGALQWLAIQTQPQLCSRCNLLLTEVVTTGTLETAREIQAMIKEVRNEPFHLEFKKLPGTRQWNDVVFVSMGDQAHSNRPQGDSTGGMLTLACGPDVASGKVVPMTLLSWRTWKLKRKAIGSNDAEVQSIVEAEDQNFRVRMLWAEIHGAGVSRASRRLDLVEAAEEQACLVRAILCTDSRGGYDAVEVNESPLLGLSNMRAALQAFQLRDNLKRVNCELRWVASDYDLADGFTKKRAESRLGLLKFLRTWVWSIAFDPNFTAAKKNKRLGKTAVQKVDDAIGSNSVPLTAAGAMDHMLQLQEVLAITARDIPDADMQLQPAIIAHDLYPQVALGALAVIWFSLSRDLVLSEP